MAGPLTDSRLFLRQFRRQFHTTGAILPSGRALAKALVFFAGRGTMPQRILEVGPGTGAVTRLLADAMGPQDRLDLVEINDQFVGRLNDRLTSEPRFQNVADRVTVIHAAVTEYHSERPYNLIVSGLPLNNFTVRDVEDILNALHRLAAPGATLSFFEYMAVRSARLLVSGPRQRARLRGIGQTLEQLFQAGEIRRDAVLLNVPPAWVHHVRLPGATIAPRGGGHVPNPQPVAG